MQEIEMKEIEGEKKKKINEIELGPLVTDAYKAHENNKPFDNPYNNMTGDELCKLQQEEMKYLKYDTSGLSDKKLVLIDLAIKAKKMSDLNFNGCPKKKKFFGLFGGSKKVSKKSTKSRHTNKKRKTTKKTHKRKH